MSFSRHLSFITRSHPWQLQCISRWRLHAHAIVLSLVVVPHNLRTGRVTNGELRFTRGHFAIPGHTMADRNAPVDAKPIHCPRHATRPPSADILVASPIITSSSRYDILFEGGVGDQHGNNNNATSMPVERFVHSLQNDGTFGYKGIQTLDLTSLPGW